jgi:hypothetical protein
MNEWDSCTNFFDLFVSLANIPSQDFSVCGSASSKANTHSAFETSMLAAL